MDAQTLIFVSDVNPVIQSGCNAFRSFGHSRVAIGGDVAEHAGIHQHLAKPIQVRLDFGLHAVDVEVFGIRMAGLAGFNARLKGVASICAHVAGDAGIFHHRVVRAGLAFRTGAGNTKQHGALRAVVRSPVAGDPGDHTVRISLGEGAARLVAVGAQVALAAVEGRAFNRKQRHRIGGLQGPVVSGVGAVYLVAGAAVLAGWMRVSALNLARVLPCGDHSAEASAGMAAGAAGFGPTYVSFTGSVKGLAPGGLPPGDQGGVVVALGAGDIRNRAGSASRTGRTSRTSRTGRTGRTLRASRTGRTLRAGRTSTGAQDKYQDQE